MSNPVDLTNLREITEGDAEMERELFTEFIDAADSYIENMGTLTEEVLNEEWRKAAHAFKGIAINLGANRLGELCKKAQENNTSPSGEKLKILQDIKQEYSGVRSFLNGILLG